MAKDLSMPKLQEILGRSWPKGTSSSCTEVSLSCLTCLLSTTPTLQLPRNLDRR